MVAENKLSLEAIPGTGRGGRVTKKDVEAYLAKQRQPAPDLPLEPWEQPGSGDLFKESAPYAAPVASSPAVISREQAAPRADGQLVPLTAMRRSIAEHMQRSVQTAPHVTTIFEVDMAAVLAHRAASLRAAEQAGIRLTLSAYFAAAAASALMQHPTLNARWTDEGILEHRDVHLGMAVALDEGLIVPVIERAQERNLLGLARAIHDLAERARQRKLRPEETRGGTFTISNHGVSGSLVATPIINQPQSGILGIGRVEKRVRVLTDAQGNDSIAIRPCCYASLTFDHRVTDGAGADAFMATFRALLEGWR
jgi:2-oxoglutarate dehydrogenase E2 component (dihydrolipoamide succinyltransferase)